MPHDRMSEDKNSPSEKPDKLYSWQSPRHTNEVFSITEQLLSAGVVLFG
jgi:hypothetical protein